MHRVVNAQQSAFIYLFAILVPIKVLEIIIE